MTVRAQRENRLRRSTPQVRRGPGAALRWWRAMRGVVLLGALLAGMSQWAGALLSVSFLAIDDFVVQGHETLSESEVLALVEPLRGQNILAADLELGRTWLVRSPRLRDGALRRVLPSTIEVFVSEWPPVAVARFAERMYLIDETGGLVDEYGPRFASFDLPIVHGLVPDGAEASIVDPVRMALANRVLRQLAPRPDVFNSVSQIDVTNPDDAVVLLNDDPALLHLGSDRFLERLMSYAELAPTLRVQVTDIDYVDLRFGSRVFVGPAAHE